MWRADIKFCTVFRNHFLKKRRKKKEKSLKHTIYSLIVSVCKGMPGTVDKNKEKKLSRMLYSHIFILNSMCFARKLVLGCWISQINRQTLSWGWIFFTVSHAATLKENFANQTHHLVQSQYAGTGQPVRIRYPVDCRCLEKSNPVFQDFHSY